MSRRSGFTLLEVLLSLGIATLLMAGLYVGMDVQLRLAQAGREKIDDAAIARALLARLTADIRGALTPIRASEAATGGGGASTTTTSTETTTNLNAVVPFNCGVIGDGGRVVVYMSRPPGAMRGAIDAEMLPNGGPDLRRVTWWLAEQGLARQEIARVTANDDGSQLPPDIDNAESFVLSPEVVQLQFQYFDGTGWVDTWDGSAPSEDGATPIGPPRAVRIIMAIRLSGDTQRTRTYQQVVAIQSANAQPVASTAEATP